MENIKTIDNELSILSDNEKEKTINIKKPIFKIISNNIKNNELKMLKKKKKSSSPKEKKIYSEEKKAEKMVELLIKCIIFDISEKYGFDLDLNFPHKGWIHFLDYWEQGIQKSNIINILYYNNAEKMGPLIKNGISLQDYYINVFCKKKDFYLLKFIRNNDLKKILKDFDFIEYKKDNYATQYRGKNIYSYCLISGLLSLIFDKYY